MPSPIINLQTFNRNKGVPVNVFPPVISGTAQVGQTLSTSAGVWTNNPTGFAYQWFTNGGAINFATASTYVPVAANVGTQLTVAVTAININGSSAAKMSAATLAVAPIGTVAPVNITPPTIPATAQVGQPITATTGTWMSAPINFSYQWFRNGVAISTGGNAATYVPVVADIGALLTVAVTASNSVGPSLPATSAPTSPVIAASTATITVGWTPATTPTFGQTTGIGFLNAASGLPGAGGVVLSSTATIQSISVYCTTAGGGSVMLGFYDNAGAGGAPGNLKASTASQVLVAGWNTIPVITQASLPAGTYWFVEIMNDNVTALGHGTGTAGHIYVGGQPFSMPAVAPAFPNTSADAIAIYATLSTIAAISMPVNTVLPVISGTAQVGQTLTASTGTWTNNPISFTYQWNRSGAAISLAQNQTYVPIAADVGNTLTVSVVANNGVLSIPATSAATNAVIAAALTVPVNTAIPTISGIAQVGQTLTASTGLWTNSPTSFAYQWFDNGVAIPSPSAMAATYVVVAASIGHTLTVSVVASNIAGPSAAAAMSLPTSAVIAAALTTITVGWTPTTTPTFGQTTGVGFLNAASGLPGAGGIALSSTATIQSISIYCTTVAGGNLLIGLYDNTGAGGTPGNLQASTASQTLVAGWNTIPVIAQVSLNAGTYWFVFIMNDSVTAVGHGIGTAGHIYVGGQPFSLPAVAPTIPNTSADSIAIYATLSTVASTGVPVNTALPIITGTAQVGQTLSASTGTWTNNPTLPFIYQWNRSGTVVATTQTYIPVTADVGNTLTVSVIAGNSFGSSLAATSAPTSAVVAATTGVPVNSIIPTISGPAPPQVGAVLTASNGIWTNSPTNFFYQWNSSGAGTTSGAFVVSGGKILGPDGKVWHGQGMAVLDQTISGVIGSISGANLANQILGIFPGINLIRIANYQMGAPTTYSAFVNVMTAAKVVCVFEPHNVNGINAVNTGAALTAETNWFASMATFYLGNPYVWFQTSNEPGLNDTAEMVASYNAVRGTGNNTIMFIEAGNGANGSPNDLSNQGAFGLMHNVGWDIHAYNWESGMSTNVATITADFNSRINAMQAVHSADGIMPVICLETGPSTTGATGSVDAGGTQEVQATFTNPNLVGVAAWLFDSKYNESSPDNLTTGDGSTLNAFGNQVKGFIGNGSSTFPGTPSGAGPINGAIGSTYTPIAGDIGNTLTVTVTAHNGTGNSLPSTSLATNAVVAAVAGVPVNSAPPTITGAPAVGTRLTVSNGTWSNNPTFTYQWQSAAPTPDIIGFAAPSGSNITVSGKPFTTQNANQAWSITNPDSQTLIFDIRNGDVSTVDVGRPTVFNRSEISYANMFTPGTEVNVRYNFTMTSPTINSLTTGMTIGQFHNDDVTMGGGGTSPPYEQDLQPHDNMSIYVANLASSVAPAGATFFGNAVVNGISLNYYQAYADPNPIVRNHTYAMQIDIKYTAAGDNSGFAKVWRDGTQIVNVTGQLGFGFNTYFKCGMYRATATEEQIAKYQNIMVASQPLVLGTGNSYVPVAADVGNAITCTVIATNGTQSASAMTAPTGTVVASSGIPQNTAIPVITGNTTVGSALTTTTGSWSIAPTSFTIQWLSAGVNATGAGATTTTYTAVTADIGHQLQVSIVAHNGTGNDSAAVFSALTNAVSTSTTPRTASLLGIFGISGHIGNYADNSHTVADAQYLGIGLWRDGISGNSGATNTIIQGLVNAGISYIGLPWLPTDQTYPGNIAGAKTILAMGPTPQGTRALFAVEGPNEPSISGFTYPDGSNSSTAGGNGNWSGVATWQHGWFQAVHADSTLNGAGVLVSTPTLVGAEPTNNGLQFLTVPTPAPGGELSAAGTTFADIYDFHLYPMYTGHCQTVSPGVDGIQGQLSGDFATTFSKGFAGTPLATINASIRICTEFGYNLGNPTAGGIIVDVPTQGKNMLTGLMNAWVEGLSGICIYTFYPFGDGNEIFNGPNNPKVSAQYIHNFTTPLVDTAATAKTFATGAVTYTISGLPSTGKSLLFQKSNLTYEVIVWNNVENWNNGAGTPITIGGTSVTVTFSSSMTTTHVYDCTVQATPIATGSGTTVNFTLKDYPMVIEGIP